MDAWRLFWSDDFWHKSLIAEMATVISTTTEEIMFGVRHVTAC